MRLRMGPGKGREEMRRIEDAFIQGGSTSLYNNNHKGGCWGRQETGK